MDHEFWKQRWRTRQIGFHQSSPHPFLGRWWPSLGVEAGSRVYVPLCGKSLDMVWLAVRGYTAVGTELSAIAVEEFFGEQRVPVELQAHGPFQRHVAGPFEMLQGDAFALTPELLGPVQAAYDRAALVALDHNAIVAMGTHPLLPFLAENGCDQMQGFFFHPPIGADDFLRMLQEHNTRARQWPLASAR